VPSDSAESPPQPRGVAPLPAPDTRPLGLTVVAIWTGVWGAFGALIGMLAAFAGGAGLALLGLLLVAWGVASLAVAHGLWTVQPRSHRWAKLLYIVGIALSLLDLVVPPYDDGTIALGVISIVVSGVILQYLARPEVAELFPAEMPRT